MSAKKRFLSLLLCGVMLFSLCPQAAFAEGVEAGGLCEHHPQHTAECGYTEGSEGTPCGHEHTEDRYTLVTECVHEHGPECYPEGDVETAETEGATDDAAAPIEPEEQEPSACAHVCSEESGCITKTLDCQHEHDETCGYAPAIEEMPCTYACEICNPQDSGEPEETEPEETEPEETEPGETKPEEAKPEETKPEETKPVAECICTGLCTSEDVNADCPVCGADGADLTACEGVEEAPAVPSDAPMPVLSTSVLAADEGYTINFAEETIAIAEGYEVYTAAAGGDKIQNGGSITAYIGQSLYIQKTGPETAGRTAISIPARPQAPNSNLISIDYDGEAITFNGGLNSDTLEYATERTNPEWKDVPSGAALSDMGWTGNQMYLYFRMKATETSFASEATTTGVQIPSRPTAPTSESIWTVRTEKSITISGVSGQEYRCGIGDAWGEWKTISSDSNSIKFEDLEPGTEYTIQNRYQSGKDENYQEHFASFANSTTVITWPLITATSLETGYVGGRVFCAAGSRRSRRHDRVVVCYDGLVSACRTDFERQRHHFRNTNYGGPVFCHN